MKYHIDGTEEFGYSTINRYLYTFYFFKNAVKRVCELYQFASVQNLKGYVAHFCYVRLVSFDTFIKVVCQHKDYVTANCILRMLGDCIAILHLIYLESDKDLLILRHALYVIDGAEKNLEVLPEFEIKKGAVKEDELHNANKQIQINREHRHRLIFEAQELLNKSPLKFKDKDAFDKIVKDRNWKFKKFEKYKRITSNQYKWTELYDRIDMSKYIDVLSYISQYTHGLSMSNLVLEMDSSNCDGIVCEAINLIDRMYDYMFQFFKEERCYILEGLLQPESRDSILACYDDMHRPSIDLWNSRVTNWLVINGGK